MVTYQENNSHAEAAEASQQCHGVIPWSGDCVPVPQSQEKGILSKADDVEEGVAEASVPRGHVDEAEDVDGSQH